MTAKEIRDVVHAAPFRPVRLFVSDGKFYDIVHPEMIFVTKRIVYVGDTHAADDVPETAAWIDPVHVTRIEPIPATNGAPRRTNR